VDVGLSQVTDEAHALQPRDLADVRQIFAAAALDDLKSVPRALGAIVLRDHQCAAAARLVLLVRANGGALLAEPVGLGKTFTALAAAARLGGSLLVAVPAALRETWRGALAQCNVAASLVTHEALSRGELPCSADIVIVDEAHRLRNPSTRRYARLADVCRRSRVILVTATPLQNRRTDLSAQLALFLGRRAWELDEAELSTHVVRGGSAEPHGLPVVDGPRRIALQTADDCLDALTSLPEPVPARDESVAAALLTYGLVHQWTSSRAALAAALRRRRTHGLALLDALRAGRNPLRAELAAWTHLGDAMQLAFPELVTSSGAEPAADIEALSVAVERHVTAVDELLAFMRRTPDPDRERADVLRRIRADHPDERIIAFCHYAETVNVLWSALSREPGVAALTAHGARIASGRVPRETVLAQFVPGRSTGVSAAERIDLLIATDLLSEGLNLQEASVVVHLDLPWNPARLEQRVGRVRRIGSRHATVTVYSLLPPAAAEGLLRIEARLREKLRVAQRTIGVAGRILPSPLAACELVAPTGGLAQRAGDVQRVLGEWNRRGSDKTNFCLSHAEAVPVAAARGVARGFIAVLAGHDTPRILVEHGGRITSDAGGVADAIADACGAPAPVDLARAAATVRRLLEFTRGRRGAVAIDFTAAASARARRDMLRRVSQAMERTPRHERSIIAPLADAARAIATTPLGEGAERILELLAAAELPDEAWLRSIVTFGALNARPALAVGRDRDGIGEPRITALILIEATPC
jgi:superfamily II DNA or RNA helicase